MLYVTIAVTISATISSQCHLSVAGLRLAIINYGSHNFKNLFNRSQVKRLKHFNIMILLNLFNEFIQRVTLEGMAEGNRGRGRPRASRAVSIYVWTGKIKYEYVIRRAQCITVWRPLTGGLRRGSGTTR